MTSQLRVESEMVKEGKARATYSIAFYVSDRTVVRNRNIIEGIHV
jgi:hypothetical protein